MERVAAAIVLWMLQAGAVAAHGDAHLFAGLGRRWEWEPVTVVLIAASAIAYAVGLRALWRRAGVGRGIPRWQAWAFAAGLGTLALTLLSPLAWLSSVLFSAHMTQHELLMLVVAPLLVFGQPLLVWLWSLPPRWRYAVRSWIRRQAAVNTWRAATAPLTVFLVHAAVLWAWHIPSLYEAALADAGVHAFQHLSFVVTAALFWWGMVHGRYGRIAYGAAVLYVFLTAVHSSVLGALITVAPAVWYPSYVDAARTWQLDPLADQQLAGLVMWVPSGLVFIAFGLALFAAWLSESDRRAALGSVWGDRDADHADAAHARGAKPGVVS